MVQSVELLLDDAAEQRIRGEWGLLSAVGLPSQDRHTGLSNRPHITVAVAAELSAQDELAVARVAGDRPPLPIAIGGALVFGARTFVLARAVIPTPDLLSYQQRVLAAMGPAAEFSAHQTRGRWAPHVTLARRLTAAQVAAALTALVPIDVIDARTVAVRRWDGDRKIDWLIG